MKNTVKKTPQIEAILSDLTQLACEAVDGGKPLDQTRVEQLTESLSVNGWKRHRDRGAPLSDVLKKRIKECCKESAMHRGASIEGIVSSIQQAYEDASRWNASSPRNRQAKAMAPRTPVS